MKHNYINMNKKKRSYIKEPYKCDKCLYETKNIVFKQHKLTERGTKENREMNSY